MVVPAAPAQCAADDPMHRLHFLRDDAATSAGQAPAQSPRQLALLERETAFDEMINSYFDFHRASFNNTDRVRYARCYHYAGFGNRFQHTISCLLFAMLSNRVALLSHLNPGYFETWWDDYFERPPITLVHYNSSMVREPDPTPLVTWLGDPQESGCNDMRLVRPDVFMLDVYPTGYYDWWGTSLVYNPVHGPLLHRLPPNWYQVLFRRVFRLAPALRQRVDEFKAAHFGKYTIGLQLRTWTRNVAGAEAVRNPLVPVELFLQAAELLALRAPVPFDDVRFLLVTPSRAYLETARQVLGAQRVVFVDGEIDELSRAGTSTGLMNFWLMGECDDLVVSEISSYGTNAAARTGKRPVVCTHERICYRRLTPDPCQDAPYPVRRSACESATPTHVYQPGVQSTCAYFGYLRTHRRWFDLYDSFAWSQLKPTWPIGDTQGVVYA